MAGKLIKSRNGARTHGEKKDFKKVDRTRNVYENKENSDKLPDKL